MPCSSCDCPFQVISTADESSIRAEMECMLEDAVQHVEYPAGHVLFMQGQPSCCLYAITSGVVKICTHTPDGREQIVGLSSPQRLLVGLQSITDERYAYSAIAATKIKACKVSHRTLLRGVQERSDLGMRLIQAVNAQLAHSRALMEVLGQKCAAAKIASFILLMTPVPANGHRDFSLPFSRMEIASLLGLSEETVCRLMASFRREGAIHAPRGKIEIRDRDRLHAIAEGNNKPRLSAQA